MAVIVKNTFLHFDENAGQGAAKRSRSCGAEPDQALTAATEQGECIDPRHPFCAPCMHTEGRKSSRNRSRRPPTICMYLKCKHCHHPDHWDWTRLHKQKWGTYTSQHPEHLIGEARAVRVRKKIELPTVPALGSAHTEIELPTVPALGSAHTEIELPTVPVLGSAHTEIELPTSPVEYTRPRQFVFDEHSKPLLVPLEWDPLTPPVPIVCLPEEPSVRLEGFLTKTALDGGTCSTASTLASSRWTLQDFFAPQGPEPTLRLSREPQGNAKRQQSRGKAGRGPEVGEP